MWADLDPDFITANFDDTKLHIDNMRYIKILQEYSWDS